MGAGEWMKYTVTVAAGEPWDDRAESRSQAPAGAKQDGAGPALRTLANRSRLVAITALRITGNTTPGCRV